MKALFVIWLLVCSMNISAQEVPINTEQQLENLDDEALEDDALLQQLAYYQKHPLNLNEAGAEELTLLRILSALQIQNLLQYRNRFGALLSIYELQAVPGFDHITIAKLLPYIKVGNTQSIGETLAARFQGGTHTALFRVARVLEKAKGFDRSKPTHYLGDRNQMQFRLNYQYKNLLYYGLVADKDAGEQFFRGAQKLGFDFYSVHFFARNLGQIKALALGDYAVNLGQGLTQWNSLAFGKSADVVNSKRQLPVLLPYRSAGEFYFSRGGAATVRLGKLEATAFVSYKKISGNMESDSIDRFTAFGTSGYYRTKTETDDRYRITHFSAGGNLSWQQPGWKVGFNAITHRFSLPLQKRDEPYNRFALSGRNHFLASVDYSYTYKNIHLFGEWALDGKLHKALVQGVLISIDPKVDLSLFYRAISKEYQSPFGNAFMESTLPSNETGLFTGLQIRPAHGWQVSAYGDFYQFPFLKYRVSAPTRGWDYLAQLTHTPDKKTEVYLRFRKENKPLNGTDGVINYPVDQGRTSLRLHWVTQVNSKLTWKARTEMLWFQKGLASKEEGFLVYGETAWEPLLKLKANVRLQYFETGSFDSRIYAYESDVLYSFSTPAFFDRGFRCYVTTSLRAGKRLTIWLRFAQTLYKDKTEIGSGLNTIDGNQRSDVKCQIQWQL
ncbi:helix-hairpin-helix domain-containing protein [Flavisolibacter sp. BT320]|nr:helix-hairpin-helix domain-containing protein [Flavisolibacter longurius]